MAVTKNVLREKVAKLNAKLEDHVRLTLSLQHDSTGYKIMAQGTHVEYLATMLNAQDADNFLEGMRSMFFILMKGGK